MSKPLLLAIQVSRFSDDTQIPVRVVCEMIALADRSARAWARANKGCHRAERIRHRDNIAIQEIAAQYGAAVEWPGLWPLITVNDRDYSLPCI